MYYIHYIYMYIYIPVRTLLVYFSISGTGILRFPFMSHPGALS